MAGRPIDESEATFVSVQVNYLNKSLDTFNTLLVYPIYYVLFTSVVLSTSIILFQEWSSMSAVDVVTTLGSFLVIVVGVALLHLFRELQVGIPSPLMSLLRWTKAFLLIFANKDTTIQPHTGIWRLISLNADYNEATDQSAFSASGEGGTYRRGHNQWKRRKE